MATMMATMRAACLYLFLGTASTACVLSFSAIFGYGFETFRHLLALEPYWPFLSLVSLALALLVYCLRTPRYMRVCGALFAICLCGAVVANTKAYPAAPLLVYCLLYPICLGVLWYVLREQPERFYLHAACASGLTCGVCLSTWFAWMYWAQTFWGRSTKMRLNENMGGIFVAYGFSSWEDCEAQPRPKDCARVELIRLLIWSCPVAVAAVAGSLTVCCAARYKFLVDHDSRDDQVLKGIVSSLLLLCTGAWVACSTRGHSMGLARVMLAVLVTSGGCLSCWLAIILDLSGLLRQSQGSVLGRILKSSLSSDYGKALMLAVTCVPLALFFALDFCARQGERAFGYGHTGPWHLTDRGVRVRDHLRDVHVAAVLEKVYIWCNLYLALTSCARLTPVFLQWLVTKIELLKLSVVCVVFYLVGLCLFMLPPVPGVPVYVAAGSIIVARARREPGLTFWPAVVLAWTMSLLLKLHAVALQQKLIGECLGSSVHIRQLVGVHTVSIRAIENILRRPGLHWAKICILCGGPDWPTSVLTGILRLDLRQMLLGTCPCAFLILPCVLGGASLTEENLKAMSPLILLLAGVAQGGTLLLASVLICLETEANYHELSLPRPEDAVHLERDMAQRAAELAHRRRIASVNLHWSERCLLVVATVPLLCVSWFVVFLSSECFRAFQIGDDLHADLAEGGLAGDVSNLLLVPGKVALAVYVMSAGSFAMYTALIWLRPVARQVHVVEDAQYPQCPS